MFLRGQSKMHHLHHDNLNLMYSYLPSASIQFDWSDLLWIQIYFRRILAKKTVAFDQLGWIQRSCMVGYSQDDTCS